jgi:hypothetical protein
VSPSSITLASGTVNGDKLSIELIEPPDLPTAIWVRWPPHPSIIPPTKFNTVAAELARLFAAAATRHTQLRAQR